MDWIGRHLGSAERRRVTILACGPAAPAEAAVHFDIGRHDEARRAIEAFGGRIIGQSGYATIACWGFPNAGEDHTRLAVRAALQIAALCGPEPRLGCAVETGLVIAGPIGGEAEAVDLVGPVLQRAERLQAAAGSGWVVASAAVKPLIETAFTLETAPAAGLAACWRVTNARPGWRRAPDAACGMVGHEAERQGLDETWLRVVEGHAQCISMTGEAGIGKSRLLRHLERKVAAARGTWIEIGCLPETSRAPLHALRRAMRELLANGAAGLAEQVAAADEADRRLLHLFLRLRGGMLESDREPGGSRQERLFALVLDWIASQAAAGPVAFVFEDLHWADPSTLDLVRTAGRRLAGMGPACLVWTSREAELGSFTTAARRVRLALGRLSSSETQQLLACSPCGSALSPATREQIAIRSEGIPLFAEELARLCVNAPCGRDGMDILLEAGPLNMVLSARLDALGGLKALAQAAAVIGRRFAAPLLAATLQMGRAGLDESLQGLVASGLIEPVPGRSCDSEFRFSHALLRDAAYTSVLKSRRRELHRRIADILAHDPSQAAEEWPEIVAGHYAAAGDRKGAFTWWHKAGMQAAEISSTRAAVDYLNQALAARARDPDAGSPAEEIDILRLLGVQLAALKGNAAPEAVATLQRCLDLSRGVAGGTGDFDTLWALHSCHLVRGEIDMAVRIGDRLTASADRDGPEERRLRAHRMQGLARLLGGRLEQAFAHYRLVLELYKESRHATLRFQHASDQGALAHAQLAWGEAIAGCLEHSGGNAEAALALSSRLQHPHTSAHVVCVLAARAQTLGDRQAASALAFAGKTLGERHEFPYWSAWADIILGWTRGSRDAGGIDLIENAIAAYRRTGAAQALPYALLLLAETALACNRPRLASSASEEGWRLAEEQGLRLYASELLRVRAEAELRLGSDVSRASDLARRAESLAASQGAGTFRSRAAGFRAHPDPARPDLRAKAGKSEPGYQLPARAHPHGRFD
ncbi:MAG: AAA family ATPase [Hyphomicrobiaceae bacterium]|nr:AAA family ATPase [Hyphomicrobiaceae bacterium]